MHERKEDQEVAWGEEGGTRRNLWVVWKRNTETLSRSAVWGWEWEREGMGAAQREWKKGMEKEKE